MWDKFRKFKPQDMLKDWIAILFVFILVLIYFIKVLFFKGLLFNSELSYIYYPNYEYVLDYLKKGIFPLWMPELFCGTSLIANIQLCLFYPLNILLFLAFPTLIALNIAVILHFFLAGLFMYIYARALKLDCASSIISSIIFMFNGFLLDCHAQLNTLSTIIWLPLILFFVEKALAKKDRPNYIYVVLAGIAFGIQFLGGHFQYSYYITFTLFGYFLLECFQHTRAKDRRKIILRLSFLWLIIFVIGAGIFAVQLLPTHEGIRHIARLNVIYERATADAGDNLSIKEFIEIIFPNFFGGDYAINFKPAYMGAVPFMLALAAIFFRKKDKAQDFCIVLGLSALVLALGKFTPFYWLLYHLRLPGFTLLKAPIRVISIFIFSIAILAGFGFNHLTYYRRLDKDSQHRIKITITVFLIAITILIFKACYNLSLDSRQFTTLAYIRDIPIGIRDHFRETLAKNTIILALTCSLFIVLFALHTKNVIKLQIFKSMSILLVFLNMYLFGTSFISVTNREETKNILEPSLAVKFFRQDKGLFRVYSYKTESSLCNKILPFGISFVSGISNFMLRRFSQFTKGDFNIDPLQEKTYPDFLFTPNLVSLLNCKYIIAPKDSYENIFKGRTFEEVYRDDACKVFLYKDHLPRAFFVNKARIIKDKEEILDALKSESFNPKDTVILEEDISFLPSPEFPNSQSQVKITKYLPNEVTIEVDAKDNGFLVLLDTNYPGWKVYIDGKKDKIYQANYLFRVVYLTGGIHKVKFIYDPFTFKLGLFITLTTLFTSTVFIGIIGYRYKREKKSEE